MKSQTSLVAKQVRLQQWAEQIRSCQNRPYGMKVDTWCSQNGITKADYYYRLRRVREAYLAAAQEADPSFVELPIPTAAKEEDELPTAHAAAVLHGPNGFTLEISNHASADFIRCVIGAMSYAE